MFILNPLKGKNKVFLLLILVFMALPVFQVLGFHEQGHTSLVPCGGPEQNACTLCDFFQLLVGIVNFILYRVAPLIAVLMLVLGGIMYLVSAGSPGTLAQARGIFTSVAIGLVLVYAAWILVGLFLTAIGANNAASWYTISITCR